MSEATPQSPAAEIPVAPVTSGVLTPEDFPAWLAAGTTPDDPALARRRNGQRFRDDGDVVILLGAVPGPLLEEGWVPDLDSLPVTLLGLIHEGVVKSAGAVGPDGLAEALRRGCGEDGSAEASGAVRGVTLDFTAWSPEARSEEAAGVDGSRFLISVSATDVGRVIRQARILDVSAVALGRVGGAGLVFKTLAGETSVAPRDLTPDRWKEWLLSPA